MFVWPIRVYFEDTDSGGVVYYANYLKYMERARTEWLRAMGIEQDNVMREHAVLFMVRSAMIDYRRPARLDDLLDVHTSLDARRGASLSFAQEIHRRDDADPRPLCSALIRVACVAAVSGKPCAIPEPLQRELDHGH